ncbi:MAG TPA: hypothetical protein VGE40_08290 [Bacilli bacterium]
MMKKLAVCFVLLMIPLLPLNSNLQAIEDHYQPVEKSPDTHPAFIQKIFKKGGKTFITMDYILWYEGEEANVKFREIEQDPEMTEAPDGYYIINNNRRLRTFEITDNASVLMQYYNRGGKAEDQDIVWNEPISCAKFISLFRYKDNENLIEYPYHFTVKKGKIVKVVQQFIP